MRARLPHKRLGLLLCLGIVMSLASVSGNAAAEKLVVGVRADAPPFSYRSKDFVSGESESPLRFQGRPRANGFDGYMVRVCDSVLQTLEDDYGADIEIESLVVNAQDRFEKLAQGEVHILCDPATIVRDRLEKAIASYPVYMSAVTYAAPDPPLAQDGCRSLVGLVSETTAADKGLREILKSGAWPRYRNEIQQALTQIGAGEESPPVAGESTADSCTRQVIKFYGTHDELAEDFCKRDTIYYVGDIEIVREKIADLKGCLEASRIAPAVFTDERYSIFAALPGDSGTEVPSKLILEFLAELSRQVHDESESLLVRVFMETNGRKYKASEKLQTFFWSLTGRFPGQTH